MTTFVDTNILIAVLDPGHTFHGWAVDQLQDCKMKGPAIIGDIVYCEFSIGMESKDHVDTAVAELGLERIRMSDAALFRAGVAFKKYKARSGTKTNVLPDFLVGALAETASAPLITTNQRDFVDYFPKLQVICP